MPVSFFTPTGYVTMAVGSTSSNILIPGTPSALIITNHGPNTVFVLGGATNAVVVTESTGHPILPGQVGYLAPTTYVAAITKGGSPFKSSLTISAGA